MLTSRLDLRLQLLEPERYPYLYKCLYGLLMLLPQSSAFAALKNRLNSVSSIGYLHSVPRMYVPHATNTSQSHSRQSSVVEAIHSIQSLQQQQTAAAASTPRTSKFSIDTHTLPLSNSATPSGSSYDRPTRLKGREDSIIRWNELLEKFRSVQDRARRAQRLGGDLDDAPSLGLGELRLSDSIEFRGPKEAARPPAGPPVPSKDPPSAATTPAKPRSGLGRQFGRLGGAVSGRGKRGQQP